MTSAPVSSRRSAKTILWRGGIGLILIGVLFLLNVLYLNSLSSVYPLFTITDFSHHGWLSGRVVLGGGDPYKAQEWLRTHWTPEYDKEIGQAYRDGQFTNVSVTRPGKVYNPEHVSDFLYPLWMAVFFSIFALLPLFWALAVFMLANEISVLIGLWCACQLLGYRPRWYAALLIVLLALGYRPTFFTLQDGAYGGVVFGALLGAILMIQRRQHAWLIGALLVFCTIKLQITIAILIFIGLWLIYRRRWSELTWVSIWGFICWGLPTIIWLGWIAEWLRMTSLASPTIFSQPTLWSLWVTIAEPYWWALGLASTILLSAILLWSWRSDLRTGRWDSLPLTFILALLIPYYAWDYDQILLLFPWLACWSWVAIGETMAARAWRFALMGWLLLLPLYIFLSEPPSDRSGYALIIPLSFLGIYLLARKQSTQRSMRPEPIGQMSIL